MSLCSVCTESSTRKNRVINCSGCDLNVHFLCYGINNDDINSYTWNTWKCSPCRQSNSKPITCVLCQQSNGAFKQSVCGKWVHIICALFTNDVKFDNSIEMEPINISKVINLKRQQPCVFCSEAKGFCCLCSKPRCKNPIHIACAQTNKCLKVISNEKTDSIKFRAFCNDHTPKDSQHCLSSNHIQKYLAKKTKKSQEKLHDPKSKETDCVDESAVENFAFEIESIAMCERKENEGAQHTVKKQASDEVASTSNTMTSNKMFLRFDAIEGKTSFYLL